MFRNFLILLFLFPFCIFSQDIVDDYIKIGLENNLALKQKRADYNKSVFVLKEARSYFMPNLSFQARYTWANGGRVIDIPVGDMINPVYYSLNRITTIMEQLNNEAEAILGQPLLEDFQVFPDTTIDNQIFNFFREREHETKLRLIQPIFNPAIYYNYKIQNELSNIKSADINTYINQLAGDIKIAYYNYIKTTELIEIINQSENLLKENLRVNQKLFENNMVTKESIYQSDLELNKLEQKRIEVEKANFMAQAYFNFLLNRDLSEPITINNKFNSPLYLNIDDKNDEALNNRFEIEMLNRTINANNYLIKSNRSNALPVISLVADYGFQGEKYEFTKEQDFRLISLMLQWQLFGGFANKQRIEQSLIEKDKLMWKKEEVEKQISIQVLDLHYSYIAALKANTVAEKEVELAKKLFDIVNKKYAQGQASMLEYLAAQNNLTQAEINKSINKHQLIIAYVEYEKAIGSYGIAYKDVIN